jgi:phosphoglucomutase
LEDQDLTNELLNIKDNENEIYERFYTDLEFGTAGLRGVIGAGINRMNIYTVRRATQGIANVLNNTYSNPSVAVSYDSRIKSDLFAMETAKVFAANGIKVYIYPTLMPTPCLSFAVRELNCKAGVMITASHNPAKYNGYKAYGEDGCQMNTQMCENVLKVITSLDIFNDVKTVDFDKALESGIIEYIDESVNEKFLSCVQNQAINPEATKNTDLHVVYTPLNGTGNIPVRKILQRIGVKNVDLVPQQTEPDGNFTTCPYPNPEIKEALKLGLEKAKEVKADLLLATDPDADRVGIAVRNGEEYELLTGNETGVLLLEYICKSRCENGTMPKNPVAVKTIVTTELVKAVAKDYGVEVIDILTGFKYIGEQIGLLEEKGEENRYILGFEESYGYLTGSYVRDKDAVNASMLICEMAAYYKNKGITLYEALMTLYKKYGRYLNTQDNIGFEGAAGMQKMKEIMSSLRETPFTQIASLKVLKFSDYQNSVSVDTVTGEKTILTLPKSNVLAFDLEDNAQVIVRPSGTEPKIKVYYTAKAENLDLAKELVKTMSADVKARF